MSERIPTIEGVTRLEIPTAKCNGFLLRIITELALAKAAKVGRINQEAINCIRYRSRDQGQPSGEPGIQRYSEETNQEATDFFNHLSKFFGEVRGDLEGAQIELIKDIDSFKRGERSGEDLTGRLDDLIERAGKSVSATFEREDLPVLNICRLVMTLINMPNFNLTMALEFHGEGMVLHFTNSSQLSITPYTRQVKGLEATKFLPSGRLVLDENATDEQLYKLTLSAGGITELETDSKHKFWPVMIDQLKGLADQLCAQDKEEKEVRKNEEFTTVDRGVSVIRERIARVDDEASNRGDISRKPRGAGILRWAVAAVFLAAPVATFHAFFGLNEKGVQEFASVTVDSVENHEPSNPFPFLGSRLPIESSNRGKVPTTSIPETTSVLVQRITPCEIGDGLHKTSTSSNLVYIFDASDALVKYPPCKK